MITQIRVPAKWHQPGAFNLAGRDLYATAEFMLGPGPCGKTVVSLEVGIGTNYFEVTQNCSCNERKTFIYPMHTLTGRVEITENDNV